MTVIDKTATSTDCQTELLKNTHITFLGGMRVFIFYEYQCVICEHLSVKKASFYAVFKGRNRRGNIISLLCSKTGFYFLHAHKFTLFEKGDLSPFFDLNPLN